MYGFIMGQRAQHTATGLESSAVVVHGALWHAYMLRVGHVVAIEGTDVLDPEVVADSGAAEARAAFAGR